MDYLQHFFNGVISGSAGLLLSHPFDTLKTRIQNKQKLTLNPRLLYKGVTSPLFGVGFEKAIVFGVYGNISNLLRTQGNSELTTNILAGGASGFCASFIVTPFERFKIMYQSEQKVLLKEINPKFLFKGLSATFTRETPGFAIYFSVFEYLKSNKKIDNVHAFLYGGISGASAWIFIYPQDMIKTKLQSSKNLQGSFMNEAKLILKTDGFKGFYKGFSFALLRAVPLHSGVFMVNEWLKKNQL